MADRLPSKGSKTVAWRFEKILEEGGHIYPGIYLGGGARTGILNAHVSNSVCQKCYSLSHFIRPV